MSSQPVLVAGVDSSTQSCKVVVCDAATGAVVREGRAAHPDGTQVDPRAWWDAYREATGGALLEGVAAIAVAGQQHGLVTLDERDEPVCDARLWNDTSSAPDALDLQSELGGPAAWVRAVGSVPVASFTVTKLRHLARCEPEAAARVRTAVLPHDWLTGLLVRAGGGSAEGWTTDRGDASGTGYFAPHTGEYRTDLVELALGRRVELPRVLAPDEAAGRGPGGLLVAAGTGDNMGAALGLGLEPGDVVVSLGTSGAVFAEHDRPAQDPSGAVAGFADATGRYLPLACTLNAARVLGAGAAMAGTDLAGLDALALDAAPGAGGLTLLPFLDGERTPDLPDAAGTLGGITRANAVPANLARACVEGMLLNLAECVDALVAQGIVVRRVLLIGGAAASRAVREVAPAVLGVPVVVPEAAEYVARGAARQAAWCLTGRLPAWRVPLAHELPGPGPAVAAAGEELRGRYAALRAQVHPGTAR